MAVGVVWAYGTVQLSLALRRSAPFVQEALEGRVLLPVGAFLPVMHGQTLDGAAITLGATTAGRSQVIIGIQAACPVCREMMPQLRAMADSLAASGDHDVVWVSLSSRDSTAAYVAEHGIRQDVFLAADERTSVLLGIRAVPTLVIVDREGRVRYRHAGQFASSAAADSVQRMAVVAKEVWRRRNAPGPDSVSRVVTSSD